MLKNLIQSITASRSAVDQALGQVDEIREQIGEKKAEIVRIEGAPLPVEEALTVFDRWAAATSAGAVDALGVGGLLDRHTDARKLGLPMPAVRVGAEMHFDLRLAVEGLLGLVVATCLPTLRRLVQEQLLASTARQETLSETERAKKLSATRAALLQLELAEESAIRSLEIAGVPVARRADADPAAVLAHDAALSE